MHKNRLGLWRRLRKTKLSTLFLISFLTVIILFNPVREFIDVTIMKYELRKAIVHYAEEYCGVKVKVTGVKAATYKYPFFQSRWSATTEPDLGGFGGRFYDDYVILRGNKCSKGAFLLDRKLNRFFVSQEDFFPPNMQLNPNTFFTYLFIFIGAIVIYIALWSFDDRRKKGQ